MPQESSPEYLEVECPFIEHLQALGWDYLPGDTGVPYLTGRGSFRQVLLADRLGGRRGAGREGFESRRDERHETAA